MIADSPWGRSYSARIDDAEFCAIRDMVAMVVEKAHARGLKVVMCPDVEVAFSELGGGIVRVEVPAGVDTVALLVLHGR